MKWKVDNWLSEGARARKAGALTAYIYKSLNWPDFYRGTPAYEVRYAGASIALIRLDGKGATVRRLQAGEVFPEISELDLVELALWVSKLRGGGGQLN